MELSAIYQKMKQAYETATGETVADDGDFGMRLQVVAAEMANIYELSEFVLKQMMPQTATDHYLEQHAAMRGLERKAAGKACGAVTFCTDAAAVQPIEIPAGTMVTSSLGNGVIYQTTETAVLPAGAAEVTVPAEATTAGKETNLSANGIDTLVSGVPNITSVHNAEAFSGGSEEEEDEHLRRRLLASYLQPTNGANLRYYEELALTVPGVWSAKAVYDQTVDNRLIIYISNFFRDTPQSLCDEVLAVLEEAREVGVSIWVQAAEPVVQNVNATVYLENLRGYANQRALAEGYLSNQIYLKGVGEDFNPYHFAEGLSKTVEGFEDLVFTKPATYLEVPDHKILEPGLMSITLAKKQVSG